MKLKLLTLVPAVLMFTACSTTPITEADKEKKVANNEMRCKKVIRTGSNISSRRCVSKEQAEQERKQSQEAMRRMQGKGGRFGDN